MIRDSSIAWYASLFNETLVDLGDCEAEAFRGVLTPKGEVGQKRHGVNAVFLENAEAYYKKYQGFDYWRMLIVQALGRIGVNDAKIIVEYGCGFGNATIPMLDVLPNSKIIASDISPNLLAILEGLLVSRDLKQRCAAVAMDAHKSYIREGSADLVFGAAILHHLIEPGEFIGSALRVLKPGGWAFFFEPLEGGMAVLRLILEEIVRESKREEIVREPKQEGAWKRWTKTMRSSENSVDEPRPHILRDTTPAGRAREDKAMRQTATLAHDLRPQIFREATPGWRDRDDKWAFPRSVLDKIARENRAELLTYGLHDNVGQFRRHFSYMLETYAGMKAADYPGWAWDIFDRYDKETFSPEMLLDLALEGCVMFRKSP
jgi:SAM-dependent methyltransferase